MSKLTNKLLGKLLIDIGTKISNGTCGLEDNEILELSKLILHRKLNIEQTCNYYGFSRATLNRKINSGEFPKPHKESGGKEYFWQDEIESKINGISY